jgi:hypothetical protein
VGRGTEPRSRRFALLERSSFQVDLVGGFFSLTFAVILGSARFSFASRREVAPRYRTAVTVWVVLLVTWSFYPVAHLFPLLLPDAATAFVLVDVGYAHADITVEAGYGSMIHHVAKVKTEPGSPRPAWSAVASEAARAWRNWQTRWV